MSGRDDWDASRIRRLDRPHPPSDDADERIRRAMLAAFDATLEAESDTPETTQRTLRVVPADSHGITAADDGDDGSAIAEDAPEADEIDLRHHAGDEADVVRVGARRRWPFLAAVAAVLLLVGAAVAVVASNGPQELNEADRNEAVVSAFCTGEFEERLDDMVDFARSPGGERTARALRSIEVLTQRYADLGAALSGGLGASVAEQGSAFVEEAANIRRLTSGFDVAIRTLANDLADAIDALPGAGSCRTAALRGEG